MIIFLNLKQKKGNRQRGMCYITINQMIMKTFVFILFFLSLASLSPTFGIPSQFRHYTVENGLSSNAVQCLLQDRTGYIWCGTSDGLNRFDSRHFKTFRHIPGDTASLGNNVIHSLFEDSKGNLWIGTENGVFRYRVSEEKFSTFHLPDIPDRLSQKIIYSIKEDQLGKIWISVYGSGVFRYNPSDGKIKHYSHDINDEKSLISNLTTKILIDHTGEVWIATHDQGVCKYDPFTDSFFRIDATDKQKGYTARYIYALCEDSFGNIWLCDNGLFKYDKTTRNCTACLPPADEPITYIHFITEIQPGILLIGSNSGLTQYNLAENTFSTIGYNVLFPQGLNDGIVYSILKDREGGIWVGTNAGGINYLTPGTNWFNTFCYTPGKTSAPGKVINSFCENTDGTIWIGTDNKGLWNYNPHDQSFTPVSLDAQNPNLSVHALYCDHHELWVGTYAHGVYRLNSATGKVTNYSDKNIKGLNPGSVYAIYKDSSGRLWFGTQTGILYYDIFSNSFVTIADLGYNSYITDITEDANHTIWFASQGKGLISYDLKTSTLKFHSNDQTGLPQSIVCLCSDQGKLRIGTGGYGLYTYNPADHSFTRHPDPLFRTHTTIQTIISSYNELWITTNAGLLRFNTSDGTISYYNQEDGLVCLPFTNQAGLQTSGGQIYIGGSNGFNVFHPQSIRKNEVIPHIVFTAFRLFNQDVTIGGHSVLQAQIDRQRSVILPHNEAVFSIEFVTTSYCAPSKNKYKYMLKGFDKTWNNTDNQNNIATYTNLSPGNYTFQVMACNNDEVWNPEKAEIRITILPPWWLSNGMLVVYGILIVLAIALGYALLLQRTNRRHRNKIAALHHENERKLFDAKIGFFTHITHEIRTPVTLILAPVEEIMRQKNIPEEIRDDLEVVKRNSERLLDLVNQILDFTKAEQEAFSSQNTWFDIDDLVEKTVQRFTSAAQQKGIQLSHDTPQPIRICTDREALTKVLSNLLTNAMKFTKDRILVSLTENPEAHTVTISVEDNGTGIKPTEKEKIFNLFYQSANKPQLPNKGFGIGLAIVSLLVKRMMGKIEVESEENRFTRFRITLPQDEQNDLSISVTSPDKTAALREVKTEDPIEPAGTEKTDKDGKKAGTVLIVEDNEEFISYLTRVIGQRYHIHTAGNGEEALKSLENLKPDIIISDVMMPVMDGIELCKRIKRDINLSHIPVILLTARTDTASKIAGLENGADVYIEKPVSVSYLYAQMVSLLENRNKLRCLFSEKPFTPINTLTETQADEKWFNRLNEIIQENISNTEFSVDQLTRSVNMSRTLLYAKVKAVTGLTPNEFIRLVRLRKAAEYLAGNEYKINEICYMVGFNSPSYFAKCFQNQFGVLPKDFINNTN